MRLHIRSCTTRQIDLERIALGHSLPAIFFSLLLLLCLLPESTAAESGEIPVPTGLAPPGTRENPYRPPNLLPNLSWNPLVSANGLNVTNYVVTFENMEAYPPDKARQINVINKPGQTNFQTTVGDPLTIPGALYPGTLYRWTVRGVIGNTPGPANSSYLRTPGPDAPQLLEPGEPALEWRGRDMDAWPGERIENLTPYLRWNKVAGADNYSFVLRDWTTNAVLTNPKGDYVGNQTYYRIPGGRLQLGHTYRWSVTAFNSSGVGIPGVVPSSGIYSSQSEVFVFTVGNWKDSRLASLIPWMGLGIVAIAALLTAYATFREGPIFGTKFKGKDRHIPLQYDALFAGSVLTFFTLLTAFDAESDKEGWGWALAGVFSFFLLVGLGLLLWAACWWWKERRSRKTRG